MLAWECVLLGACARDNAGGRVLSQRLLHHHPHVLQALDGIVIKHGSLWALSLEDLVNLSLLRNLILPCPLTPSSFYILLLSL